MQHILIADDHEITRRGLREILTEAFAGAHVAEAIDFAQVLEQIGDRTWDLIVLDFMMPGGKILDLLAKVRRKSTAPILMLTAITEIELVIATMKAGAKGFLEKHRAADALIEAARRLGAGGSYLHPDTATAVAAALLEPRPAAPHDKLSERELEIFLAIGRGRAIKEIAADLRLSDKTVATYLGRIRDKTGLTSYVDIIRYVLQHKLVE